VVSVQGAGAVARGARGARCGMGEVRCVGQPGAQAHRVIAAEALLRLLRPCSTSLLAWLT